MEFSDYAEQFRRRTAYRMAEFEKVLKQSQRQMEELVRQQELAKEMNIQKPPRVTPQGVYRGFRPGKVQGVLRKEGPTENRD
ncbi:hypothetical protein QP994_04050 [Corynebacterium sp. MSK044]|uniref:hypothetical protein n=1 Tax=Corynebacterium sp. MSK044 TaxID=3050195 RepID=UPI00254E22BB|nr:hypothetical protein [Corynebacterium sp. MSK044]MDK8797057.1 hypothetical protein [Corynebacterium sp. MSK044]